MKFVHVEKTNCEQFHVWRHVEKQIVNNFVFVLESGLKTNCEIAEEVTDEETEGRNVFDFLDGLLES